MSISINKPDAVHLIELIPISYQKPGVFPFEDELSQISGTMSLVGFTNCTNVKVQGSALAGIDFDFSNNQYQFIRVRNNKLTGVPDSISNQTNLKTYDIAVNSHTGVPVNPPDSIVTYDISNNEFNVAPDLSNCPNLQYLFLNGNVMTGIGSPDISNSTNLESIQFDRNDFSGELSNFHGLTGLKNFSTSSNSFAGDVPEISGATGLERLWINDNKFTGNIPDVNDNTALIRFDCSHNNLTGWSGSAFPDTLRFLYAHENYLSSDTIDAILGALVTAGRSNSLVNIGGTNAPAGSAGVTAKNTLEDRGWSVTVNE